MPQKKAKKVLKKAAVEKTKKPAKTVKTAGLGAAIKKAAKTVAKTVGLAPVKKGAAPKKVLAAKPEKILKKVEVAKKPLPPIKGKKEAPTLTLVKSPKKEEIKKEAKAAPAIAVAAPAPAALVKGKKGKEVVVVVPAPKGVATLLAKDGKGKKSKAAAEAAAAKQRRCREPGCDHEFTLVGYCRAHYIKNWRRIKRKETILASGQLNNYVEELVNKYPDKYLDVIRQDLSTEKEWGKVVVDLELESTEEDSGDNEDIDAAAEGVRPASGGGGGSRGEFDDEGDAF